MDPSPTAAVTLDLVTARTISRGLGWLGILWEPTADVDTVGTSRGLYAWTVGRGTTGTTDTLDRGVAYVGVGEGDTGVIGRLADEKKWVGGHATHGHGRAMHLLDGQAVAGTCEPATQPDLGWLDETIGGRGATILREWLAAAKPSTESKAERLAVRIALHVGDVAPPVNSQWAGVWDTDHASDWGGYAVALRLAGRSVATAGALPATPAGARPGTEEQGSLE